MESRICARLSRQYGGAKQTVAAHHTAPRFKQYDSLGARMPMELHGREHMCSVAVEHLSVASDGGCPAQREKRGMAEHHRSLFTSLTCSGLVTRFEGLDSVQRLDDGPCEISVGSYPMGETNFSTSFAVAI